MCSNEGERVHLEMWIILEWTLRKGNKEWKFLRKILFFALFKSKSVKIATNWNNPIRELILLLIQFNILKAFYCLFLSFYSNKKTIEGICLIFLFNKIIKYSIAIGACIWVNRHTICDNGNRKECHRKHDRRFYYIIHMYKVHCKMKCLFWGMKLLPHLTSCFKLNFFVFRFLFLSYKILAFIFQVWECTLNFSSFIIISFH